MACHTSVSRYVQARLEIKTREAQNLDTWLEPLQEQCGSDRGPFVMTMKNALERAKDNGFRDKESFVDALTELMRVVGWRTKERLLSLHSALVVIFDAEIVPDLVEGAEECEESDWQLTSASLTRD